MSESSSKKRKLFVDLSEDLFVQKEDPKKTLNKSENLTSSKQKEFNNKKEENEKFLNDEKEFKKVTSMEKFSSNESTEKSTVISDTLNIIGEEPLNKGYHFYSNDRVMNKVKRFAKEKNIKLSRLITIILDKTIREE